MGAAPQNVSREGFSAPTVVGVTSTLDFHGRGYGGFVYTVLLPGDSAKAWLFGMLHLDLLPGTHVDSPMD